MREGVEHAQVAVGHDANGRYDLAVDEYMIAVRCFIEAKKGAPAYPVPFILACLSRLSSSFSFSSVDFFFFGCCGRLCDFVSFRFPFSFPMLWALTGGAWL